MAGAGAEARCLSRVWGFLLLSAFPAHDSTQGWACGFPVAAWESRATWRAGRSPRPCHPVTSYLVTSSAAPKGQGMPASSAPPRQTTQSSRSSQEHCCYLSPWGG